MFIICAATFVQEIPRCCHPKRQSQLTGLVATYATAPREKNRIDTRLIFVASERTRVNVPLF
jgi:hypothetical protein